MAGRTGIILLLMLTATCYALLHKVPLTKSISPRLDNSYSAVALLHKQSPMSDGHPLPIVNIAQSQYFFNISIGSPRQTMRVAANTGTSDLWVMAREYCPMNHFCYSSRNSSTYRKNGSHFEWLGTDGWEFERPFSGFTSGDQLVVGDMVVPQQPFGEVIDTPSGFVDWARYDGVLGLGLAEFSANGIHSPLHNMILNGVLDANDPTFSIYLGGTNNSRVSEIVFGGYDPDHFLGDLIKLPVPDNATDWQLTLDSLSVGDESFTDTKNIKVVLDTSISYIGLPANLKTLIESRAFQGRYGYALCEEMDQLPDIIFKFSGHAFTITPHEYLWAHDGDCLSGIMQTDHSIGDTPTIILGSPFFSRWYSVYSVKERTVSLALAKA